MKIQIHIWFLNGNSTTNDGMSFDGARNTYLKKSGMAGTPTKPFGPLGEIMRRFFSGSMWNSTLWFSMSMTKHHSNA